MATEQQLPDPLLNSYIEAEKAKIKIEPYDDKVVNGAFKQRTFGLWAGTAMGMGWGTIAGAGICLALPLFNVGMTLALAGQVIALFSAIGLVVGNTAGQIIGAAAGASATAAQERERRDKAEALEKEIKHNPPSTDVMQSAIESHQTQQAEIARTGKGGHTITMEDIHKQTGGDYAKTFLRTINMRMVVTSAVLGAIVGAVLVMGGGTTVTAALVKIAPSLATLFAKPVVGPIIGAAFGAMFTGIAATSFGFKFPQMFTSLSRFTHRLFTGQIFEKEKQQEQAAESAIPKAVPELTPALSQAQDNPVSRFTVAMMPAGSFVEQATKECGCNAKTTIGF